MGGCPFPEHHGPQRSGSALWLVIAGVILAVAVSPAAGKAAGQLTHMLVILAVVLAVFLALTLALAVAIAAVRRRARERAQVGYTVTMLDAAQIDQEALSGRTVPLAIDGSAERLAGRLSHPRARVRTRGRR